MPTTTPIEDVWDDKGNLPTNAIVATAAGKYPALDGSLITGIAGNGDMNASIYDPTTVQGDSFDMDNMVEGTTNKLLSAAERSAIIANTAKVTNATHTGDVTGDTALTIAAGAVDLAMLSATGTASITTFLRGDNTFASIPIVIQGACSDETSALTTGTAKLTVRAPAAFTLTAVRASVTTAPTGSTLIIDVNEGGVSVLSTKITIDPSETTSTTAATAPVISDNAIADDAELTIDIDQIGSTGAGAGLKITLIGSR